MLVAAGVGVSRCRCRADGVSWVISSNDITYHSSSFPPDVGVGEDVVVGEGVSVDKGVDGVKDVDNGRVGGGG